MDRALAQHYGTAGAGQKTSSRVDVELQRARSVVELLDARGIALHKASAADIEALPLETWGVSASAALEKASAHLPRVRAWLAGEADGRALARHGIKATFERAWSSQ